MREELEGHQPQGRKDGMRERRKEGCYDGSVEGKREGKVEAKKKGDTRWWMSGLKG